ncbi:MAG: CHRD domain-containing protein [bacterium]
MRSFFALLCSALICSCSSGGDKGPLTGPAGASVSLMISSNDAMTSAGDTRAVTAVVTDANGTVVSSPSVVWNTSAPAVAAVSETGSGATITAVGDGTATITATSGSTQGTVTVAVHRKLASVVLSAPAPVLTIGSTMQLIATGRDARQNPIPGLTGFLYSSSGPDKAVVSSSGLVSGLVSLSETPTATITATLTRDGITAGATTEITVRPPAGFDFAAFMLTEYERQTRVPTPGIGIAYFFVDGAKVNYIVTWSALSGPAISAHIHGAAGADDEADILVDLPIVGQTTNLGSITGSFTVADIRSQNGHPVITPGSLIELMRSSTAYVDVHTAAYAGGEIRGQTAGPFN